jgi:hypothetical protein
MRLIAALTLTAIVGSTGPAWSQGGAGQTGTISGTISDEGGGVMPGVTVTATSPSMISTQTVITDEQGAYRFAGIPAGQYTLRFELVGFTTIVREKIAVPIGFSAVINVRMTVQALEETVTVRGQAAVVDVSSTRVQTNYTKDILESLPSARDMYGLIAVTPSMSARVDVGGNTLGQQLPYRAYGFSGQNRPMVESMNMSDVSAGGIFMFQDYGSLDEAFVSGVGNGAEVAMTGVQMNFVAKSGGDRFSGGLIADFQTEGLQSYNIAEEQIRPDPAGPVALADREANRLHSYSNFNADLGGPVMREKMWFYFSTVNKQRNKSRQPPIGAILDGTVFENALTNYTAKTTYNVTPTDKIIGYVQYGVKYMPFRTDGTVVGNPQHQTFESTRHQDSPLWVWKGEYNRTFGQNGFLEARYGGGGYTIDWTNYTDQPRREDLVTNLVTGGGFDFQTAPRRSQFTGAYSWFLDRFLGGDHNVKFGLDLQREWRTQTWRKGFAGDVIHLFRNEVANQVRLLVVPTESEAALWNPNAFITDTITVKRVTLNVGLRYDRYTSYLPEQSRPVGRFNPVEEVFPAVSRLATFNHIVPRVGVTIDPAGDQKMVVKANYGRFGFHPGVLLANAATPNPADQYSQHNWTDLNGDRTYQPGEEGALVSRVGGAANAFLDPNLEPSYADEFSTFFERSLPGDLGIRTGYVWKRNSNGYQQMNVLRPIEAYNIPVQVPDPGAPGQTIAAFNLGPVTPGSRNVVQNIPGYSDTYRTFEVSATKRYSNRWSLTAAYSYTRTNEDASIYAGNRFATSAFANFAGNSPTNPNDRTRHDFGDSMVKLYGTVEPFWGVRISPLFRYDSGQNYGRIVLASLNYNAAQPILVEPIGTRKQESLKLLDVKVDKQFSLRGRIRLGAYLEMFNVLNANTATAIVWTTGPRFEHPVQVLPPRVARLGAKFSF